MVATQERHRLGRQALHREQIECALGRPSTTIHVVAQEQVVHIAGQREGTPNGRLQREQVLDVAMNVAHDEGGHWAHFAPLLGLQNGLQRVRQGLQVVHQELPIGDRGHHARGCIVLELDAIVVAHLVHQCFGHILRADRGGLVDELWAFRVACGHFHFTFHLIVGTVARGRFQCFRWLVSFELNVQGFEAEDNVFAILNDHQVGGQTVRFLLARSTRSYGRE